VLHRSGAAAGAAVDAECVDESKKPD